jgi:hypothetical protein
MAQERSSLNRNPNELGAIPQGSATFAATTATSPVPSSLFPTASPLGQPGSTSNSNSAASASGSDNKAVSTGAIVGIAVAAVAGLGLMAAAATWFLRRKRKQDRNNSDDSEIKPYAFTTPGGDGAASDPVARENGVNREVGQHFEKDGDPIQNPVQSQTVQSPNPAYSQPMQGPISSRHPSKHISKRCLNWHKDRIQAHDTVQEILNRGRILGPTVQIWVSHKHKVGVHSLIKRQIVDSRAS